MKILKKIEKETFYNFPHIVSTEEYRKSTILDICGLLQIPDVDKGQMNHF